MTGAAHVTDPPTLNLLRIPKDAHQGAPEKCFWGSYLCSLYVVVVGRGGVDVLEGSTFGVLSYMMRKPMFDNVITLVANRGLDHYFPVISGQLFFAACHCPSLARDRSQTDRREKKRCGSNSPRFCATLPYGHGVQWYPPGTH
jgi:hypothetical protein